MDSMRRLSLASSAPCASMSFWALAPSSLPAALCLAATASRAIAAVFCSCASGRIALTIASENARCGSGGGASKEVR